MGCSLDGPAILLLIKIAGLFDWADAPFSWHFVPDEVRGPVDLDVLDGSFQDTLQIYLVDASIDILRSLRIVNFTPEFTAAIRQVIAAQSEMAWDEAAYDAALDAAYTRWPAPADMVRAASITCVGGG